VTQSTDALDGDQITGAGVGVAQGIEDGDAGAQKRGGLGGVESVGDVGDRFRRRDGVLGVSAVEGDARDLGVFTGDEVPFAARLAIETMATVPADADALALSPGGHTFADRVDTPDDFVAWNPRILDPGVGPLFDERVRVADATGFDGNADFIGPGLRDIDVYEFKISAWFSDLYRFHRGHGSLE
jgi:hypothetical protein